MTDFDRPFRGRLGRTSTERIHVPWDDGSFQSIEVYRSIDVTTDPQLLDRLIDGTLHAAYGPPLALPIVVHDPERALFVLALPEVLRHDTLQQRARLLRELAEEKSADVPAYVAEASFVIGIDALRALFRGDEADPGAGILETSPGRLGPLDDDEPPSSGVTDLTAEVHLADFLRAEVPPAEDVDELVDDEDVEDDVEDPLFETPRPVHTGPPPFSLGELDEAVIEFAPDGAVEMSVDAGEDVFGGHSFDLRVRLQFVLARPIVMIDLISGSETIRRTAYLDPRNREGRSILDALEARFEARVRVFEERVLIDTFVASAPRELNVTRLISRITRAREVPKIDVEHAIALLRAEPPREEPSDWPFSSRITSASSASEAHERLESLMGWSSTEQMDQVLLVHSVPGETVEAIVLNTLEDAIRYGLSLPDPLLTRAIDLRLAEDPASLIERQILALYQTTTIPGRGGLEPEVEAIHWERLLLTAASNDVPIDPDIHEHAWRAVRTVRGEGSIAKPTGEVEITRITQMGIPELLLLLEHPRYRAEAALELLRRRAKEHFETVARAVRKMNEEDILRVAPQLSISGDDIGDALIEGLHASSEFARLAFALCLERLNLRRSVVPLLHLLINERTDAWREIARIYATFGNAAFRTFSQKLAAGEFPEERVPWLLAHFWHRGSASQVDALERSSEARSRERHRASVELRDAAAQQIKTAQESSSLDSHSVHLTFSARFHEVAEALARRPLESAETPISTQ